MVNKAKYDSVIAHFARDDNDQDDVAYLRTVQSFLGSGFRLYDKSVCFTNKKNKKKWKGVKNVSQATCVPISSFNRHSTRWIEGDVHVAVVEGTTGRVQRRRGDPIVPPWGEFHSCLVMVHKIFKRIYVHNPWREGLLRSRTVTRVNDIRPKLVMKMVKSLGDNYHVYHYSGHQVHTSDCRVQLLQFAKRLGKIGRNSFHKKIHWRQIKWSGKA